MFLQKIYCFVLAVFLLSSCLSNSEDLNCQVPFRVERGEFGLQGTWRLIGFKDQNRSNFDFPPCEYYAINGGSVVLNPLLLTFTSNKYSRFNDQNILIYEGNSTVNTFNGVYQISDNQKIMHCCRFRVSDNNGQGLLIDYEDRYFEALQKMSRYFILNNILTITFGENDHELVFVRFN